MVRIEGRTDEGIDATIRRVDRMPKPRLRGHPVQYFETVLELEKTDPLTMKPGQRIVAKLALDEREGALVIPRQAVFEDDGGAFVYRLREGGFEKVKVGLGPPSLGRIAIESGLSEGDVVAARNPELSRDDLVPSAGGASPERGAR